MIIITILFCLIGAVYSLLLFVDGYYFMVVMLASYLVGITLTVRLLENKLLDPVDCIFELTMLVVLAGAAVFTTLDVLVVGSLTF